MKQIKNVLPPKQANALLEILKFKTRHGYFPTFSELAEVLNCSKENVRLLFNPLVKKGIIIRHSRVPRSYEISDTIVDFVTTEGSL